MVSIEGYAIGEYVFAVVATYLLIVICTVMWMVVFATRDKNYWVPLSAGAIGAGSIQLLYWFGVRLATVTLVNGILVATSIFGIAALMNYYFVEDEF